MEARHPGQDDWTTLPDLNGNTSQATGSACPLGVSGGWRTLHPHLDHYQTQVGTTDCSPVGTTGVWNAGEGNSGGWEQWQVDLGAYAGGQVEISIAYVSDWATQGLGVFVDDIVVSTGQGSTSFEGADTGGWQVTGPPPGSAPNVNNFVFTDAAGFPEGATITTEDSLLLGFGLEAVTGADARAEVMGRAMDYFLGP